MFTTDGINSSAKSAKEAGLSWEFVGKIVIIENNKIKNFGSQGQQKSFLIALKLAQFDYYKTKFGNSPIVLLDDIFDKLDQERVRQIVQILEKKDFSQIFITDTHIDRVKDALSGLKNKEEIFDLEKIYPNE